MFVEPLNTRWMMKCCDCQLFLRDLHSQWGMKSHFRTFAWLNVITSKGGLSRASIFTSAFAFQGVETHGRPSMTYLQWKKNWLMISLQIHTKQTAIVSSLLKMNWWFITRQNIAILGLINNTNAWKMSASCRYRNAFSFNRGRCLFDRVSSWEGISCLTGHGNMVRIDYWILGLPSYVRYF